MRKVKKRNLWRSIDVGCFFYVGLMGDGIQADSPIVSSSSKAITNHSFRLTYHRVTTGKHRGFKQGKSEILYNLDPVFLIH